MHTWLRFRWTFNQSVRTRVCMNYHAGIYRDMTGMIANAQCLMCVGLCNTSHERRRHHRRRRRRSRWRRQNQNQLFHSCGSPSWFNIHCTIRFIIFILCFVCQRFLLIALSVTFESVGAHSTKNTMQCSCAVSIVHYLTYIEIISGNYY